MDNDKREIDFNILDNDANKEPKFDFESNQKD